MSRIQFSRGRHSATFTTENITVTVVSKPSSKAGFVVSCPEFRVWDVPIEAKDMRQACRRGVLFVAGRAVWAARALVRDIKQMAAATNRLTKELE